MPVGALIRDAAERFAERVAERPLTGTGPRRRKKARRTKDASGQPKEYGRKVSRAEKALFVAALYAIAERADEGISGIRGTDAEWVWFARRATDEKIQATTIPLRRAAWKLLLGDNPSESLPGGQTVEARIWENVVDSDTVTEIDVVVRDAAGAVIHGTADPAAATYLRLDARMTDTERQLAADRLMDSVRALMADRDEIDDAKLEAIQARLDENARTGKLPKVVISGGAILLIFATWITWQYRHLKANTVDFGVEAALTVDGKPGALVRWRDLDPESGDAYYIYRDGRLAHTMDIPAGAHTNKAETFAWFDEKIKFGENHTYKLGRKLARSIIIDVGSDVDLKPCWKCLEDALHSDFKLDDETRRIIETEQGALDLWAIAGFPKRFGGRIAAPNTPADPSAVPPVSTVRVDFGDGTPPAIYDSNNIVHTYIAPGQYTIRLTDLRKTPAALAPIPIRVLGRMKIPSLRIAPIVKFDESTPFAFALAVVPGHPTILPLHRFLGAIHADLRGEFLENLYMNIDWHDGGDVEELDVRNHVRRTPNGYEVTLKARHQWNGKNVPKRVTVFAVSDELGRMYVGSIPVVGYSGRRSPLTHLNENTEVWQVVLESGGEIQAPLRTRWSFSTLPWLYAVRDGAELFDPATAIVAVDFGDGNPQVSSDPTRSVDIAFGKTGQTWAYLTIYDPKMNRYFGADVLIKIQ